MIRERSNSPTGKKASDYDEKKSDQNEIFKENLQGYPLKSLLGLVTVISICFGILYVTVDYFQRTENFKFKLPQDINDLRMMKEQLSHLLETNSSLVLLFFSTLYILKQTFSIPGSALLNLLAGDLFGFSVAFPLVCLLTTMGASCCYWLSYTVGKSAIRRLFSEKIKTLGKKVSSNRSNLFYYLLFIRMVPFTPNWLLNIAAPILDIPFHLFFFSVLVGLMPYNFVTVQAGSLLAELTSLNDVFDFATMLKLVLVALVALFPAILKRKYQSPHVKLNNGV